MPFPHYERIVFEHNPLEQVICQLRFPTILKIDKNIDEFQDAIREIYPNYLQGTQANVEVSVVDTPVVQLPSTAANPTIQTVYQFSSRDNNWVVGVSNDFIALTTRDYHTWEEFEANFRVPYNVLIEMFKPSFFQRTGLRYANVIHRTKIGISLEVPWTDLLQPHVASLLTQDIADVLEAQNIVALIKLPEYEGLVRSQQGSALHAQTGEKVYFIDNDFYTEKPIGLDDVFNVLTTFRSYSGSLFNWCITDKLRAYLGRQTKS